MSKSKKKAARRSARKTSAEKPGAKRIGRPPKTDEQRAADAAATRKADVDRAAGLRDIAATSRVIAAQAEEAAEAAASASLNKNRAGQHPFEPTVGQRKLAHTLSGLGLRQDEIAVSIINPDTDRPISEETLRKYFAHELAAGPASTNRDVAESLFKKAKGNGPQAVTAGIWWSKCRMGWKERTVVEVEDKSGVLVSPAAMTPAQWIAAVQAANRAKREPGTEENDGQ